jgi:hypothetical protein
VTRLISSALLGAVCAWGAEEYRILDPLAVPAAGDASAAVVTVARPATVPKIECDLVIAGGGLGGVAAALAGARGGLRVCLTETTRWLGGQMTSQGVSALDENRWIETTGAARSYQDLRQRIRAGYDGAANPGRCWVSALCFEPKAGVDALEGMLESYRKSGALRVMLRTAPVGATRAGKKLQSILVYGLESHQFAELHGAVFIDATELGDLLPLAGAGFHAGAESRADTGEADAPDEAAPELLQSFTYPFVLAENPSHGIKPDRPASYQQEREHFTFVVDYGEGRFLRYGMFDKLPNTPGSFWSYRRLIAADQFPAGKYPTDFAMINWNGNDVCDAGYLSADPLTAARAMQHGKQVALNFAWWIEHEAPHDKGDGAGFPGLALLASEMGSSDGLSQFPYIRESRRMNSLRTVREQDVAVPWQPGARAANFDDTAGIGFYPIDIHGCTKGKRLPTSKPYQIPLGALMSRDVSNLLAGAKDLGTTHITNGAYRLHPTEWAIGEAGGWLAAWAIRHRREPVEIDRDHEALRVVQWQLLQAGHPLVWFDDVLPDDPAFAAIQFAAVDGLIVPDAASLHFRPGDPMKGEEAAAAVRELALRVSARQEIPEGIESQAALEWPQLAPLGHGAEKRTGAVKRAEFAQWLVSWRIGR